MLQICIWHLISTMSRTGKIVPDGDARRRRYFCTNLSANIAEKKILGVSGIPAEIVPENDVTPISPKIVILVFFFWICPVNFAWTGRFRFPRIQCHGRGLITFNVYVPEAVQKLFLSETHRQRLIGNAVPNFSSYFCFSTRKFSVENYQPLFRWCLQLLRLQL